MVVFDAFLKDNVAHLNNASLILSRLSPKTYTFKTQQYPSMHLDEGNQIGLIADEVEQILPELVHPLREPEVRDNAGNLIYDKIDFKALNYNGLIPVLIAGFKEQQAQITALTEQLNNCCTQPRSAGDAGTNKSTIELENLATLQLLQNDPNHFSESTYVRWNLPNEFKNAVVYFYNNSGSRINTFEIKTKGQGELQIFGSRLSSGIYTYSLKVDGKVIDTKKMVKAK